MTKSEALIYAVSEIEGIDDCLTAAGVLRLKAMRLERAEAAFDPAMKIEDRPCLWFAAVMLVLIGIGQVMK